MMLMCSCGTSSPRLSRSLLPPQSSPVVGLNARPTVLRSPRAKMRPAEPSRLNWVTAARMESRSSHRLQDDPTARYSLPSGPKRIVRVERPPPRSEEHTSELQSRGHLVCRLLLEKKKSQLY